MKNHNLILLVFLALGLFSCKKDKESYKPAISKLEFTINGETAKNIAIKKVELLQSTFSTEKFINFTGTYADTGQFNLTFPLVPDVDLTTGNNASMYLSVAFIYESVIRIEHLEETDKYISTSGRLWLNGVDAADSSKKIDVKGTFENLLYEKP